MAAALKILALAFAAALFNACGSDSNIWAYITSDDDKKSVDAAIASGKAAYDRNQLDVALKHATVAYNLDPLNEEAALLYGFVNLSLAKADPISLAAKMAGDKESEESGEASAELAEGENSSSGSLDQLKTALGLTDEDIVALGTLDETDPEIPVLIPKCVEDAREGLDALNHLDEAVRAICPFVGETARLEVDVRHNCEATTIERRFPYKSSFLWAFTHLAEALAFYSVLTYGNIDPEGKKTNLELRVAKIQQNTVTDLAALPAFIENLESLERTVSSILPVGGACSPDFPTAQLQQTVNNLLTVTAAFADIPQIPESIKNSITDATKKITDIQGGTAGDGKLAQAKALKGDFTKKLAGPLAQKIDALSTSQAENISPEQAVKLCESFDSIAAGGAQKPALCQALPPR
jgi:hypothetical protein